MTATMEKLEQLVRLTRQDVAQLLAKAVELGIEQLWVRTILDLYLRGELSREEAVRSVGAKLVEQAERLREAVLEDTRWGLGLR